MFVPRRPDSLSPFHPVRLTPAGIHRVEVALTSEPWLQRRPMLSRFAGRPSHQQTLCSPLVLSAEQSTAILPARSTRLPRLGKPLTLDPPVASCFAACAT